MLTAVCLLLSYLIGAIPFSWLVACLYKVDLQKVGSGNIGFTNVFRNLGPVPGAIALLLDFGKGYLATFIAISLGLSPTAVMLCVFCAILGHTYSVFLKFKGGKGVATGLGTLAAFAPEIFAIMAIYAILVILITRYVSLASVTGVIIVVILMFMFDEPIPYTIGSSIAAAYIIIKHIPNIKRLLSGAENKI